MFLYYNILDPPFSKYWLVHIIGLCEICYTLSLFENNNGMNFISEKWSEKYIQNFSLNSYYASLDSSNGYNARSLGFSVFFSYLYIIWNIIRQSLYLTYILFRWKQWLHSWFSWILCIHLQHNKQRGRSAVF